MGGVVNVVPKYLQATVTFRVSAAADDPNTLVEYRDLQPGEQLTVKSSEIVLDRIPPIGQIDLGVTYLGFNKLRLQARVYDLFNAGSFYADAFHDYNVRLEPLANPRPGFRFILSATLLY